jgi:hypothetical protein
MTTVLADRDVEGQAFLLWGTLSTTGWLELLPMRLVRLADVGLPADSTDREVWRFAQANQMLLLTNNRNMEGVDSLEQTIRDEGHITVLPVITIARAERMSERAYREQCVIRLLEIVIELEDYRGVGRIFIP